MTTTPNQDLHQENSPNQQSNRTLIILYSISVAFYWASMYLYMPTLSIYVEGIAGDLALVGTILSMYGLWQGIVRFPMGILSDWLGKYKPFIIFGYCFSAAGAWLMGYANDSTMLFFGRSFVGIAAATWVPLVVAFSNLFPPKEAVRATAILTAVNSIGRVFATSVTGTLNSLGGYRLAFNLAILAAGLAILTILLTREPKRARKKISLAGLKKLTTRTDVMLPSVLDAVTQFIVWAGPYTFFPIVARNLGATEVMISILVSMYLVLFVIGNFSVSSIVKIVKPVFFLYVGFFLLAVSMVLVALSDSYWEVFIAQLIAGFATGVTYPVLMGMSIENVQNYERSTAMGLHQTVYSIGMFVGPSLGGLLADSYGMQFMFTTIGLGCGILGILGTRRLSMYQKRSSEQR